jgi:hypothetical protein
MTKKTAAKADLSKGYVAALDTIFEGKPVREGVPVDVKGMAEERVQEYLDAGLIELPDEPSKEAVETSKQLSEEAAKIDTSGDKRTEK